MLRFAFKLTLSVFCLASLGFSTTIDFSDLNSGSCAYLGASANSGGYSFSAGANTDGLFLCDGNVLANDPHVVLINANQTSEITMSQIDGGTFTLNSFSAGARADDGYTPATALDVLGFFQDNSTVDTTLSLTGTNFELFQLPTTFSNLVSVTITALSDGGIFPEYAINNITVNAAAATPEPASLLLFGAGLLGIGVIRRQSRI